MLKNIDFLNVLLNSDISKYYASLHNLNKDTYDFILKYILQLKKSTKEISKIFSYFNSEYKLEAIDKFDFSEELIYEIFKYEEPSVINKIINKYNIDLSKNDIDICYFFEKAKESYFYSKTKKNHDNIDVEYIQIPSKMINKELSKKMWNTYDIFQLRAIINDMEYCTDSSLVNEYVKNKEEEIISSYTENSMLSPFKEIYDLFLKYKKSEIKYFNNEISDDYYENRKEYFNYLNKINDITYFNKLND